MNWKLWRICFTSKGGEQLCWVSCVSAKTSSHTIIKARTTGSLTDVSVTLSRHAELNYSEPDSIFSVSTLSLRDD